MRILLWIFLIMSLADLPANADQPTAKTFEINTQLMETTFRLSGASASEKDKISFGTAFILGKPISDNQATFVMVTAAHVLTEIKGDTANLHFRHKKSDGSYAEFLHPVAIRQNDTPLYVKHPSVDVAALYVVMPNEFATVSMLNIASLADDDILKRFEIHPGDELLCLGYPLGLSGPHGYPILRSGKIASYPLVPAKNHANWAFDFRIFKGNSGGPVYFIDRNRTYSNQMHLGETIQFLAGLITAQVDPAKFNNHDLSIGIVIPAAFVRETLDILPAKSPYLQ